MGAMAEEMSLSGNWVEFANTELDVFLIDPIEMVVYVAVAFLCWFFTPLVGPVLLREKYIKGIEQYEYSDGGIENIVFRILAPVLASNSVLMLIVVLARISFAPGWTPQIRWMPILMYWFIHAAVMSSKQRVPYPAWALLVQASTSLITALYFDWVVVCRIEEDGIFAFDQSNIGWQMLVIAFFAVGMIVLSGLKRGVSKYNSWLEASYRTQVSSFNGVPRIDPKVEKAVFSYVRRFDELLPDTFKQDVLLRALFYTVMLIEDSNRPWWFRLTERMFFWTKRVRTTGIMQVKSPKRLSDRESVRMSIPIVQKIWNSFVMQVAELGRGGDDAIVSFTRDWYKYDFNEMRRLTAGSMSHLYGRYCGTFTLDASGSFSMVSALLRVESEALDPRFVYVSSKLFESAAAWVPGCELCFKDSGISLLVNEIPDGRALVRFVNNDGPERSEAQCFVGRLLGRAVVISVEFVPRIRCVVVAALEGEDVRLLTDGFPRWTASTMGAMRLND